MIVLGRIVNAEVGLFVSLSTEVKPLKLPESDDIQVTSAGIGFSNVRLLQPGSILIGYLRVVVA